MKQRKNSGNETGSIKLPRGRKTANEKAKELAEPSVLEGIGKASEKFVTSDEAKKNDLAVFAERINPRKYGYSPKLAAIVGAIIGYDYGVRDGKGGKLGHISITSDGFVQASSTAHESGAFIGDARELAINIQNFLKDVELSKEEGELWNSLYAANVTDWRR